VADALLRAMLEKTCRRRILSPREHGFRFDRRKDSPPTDPSPNRIPSGLPLVSSLARTNLWQNDRTSRFALTAALALLAGIYISSPSFEWSRAANDGPFGGDALQEWLGGYVVLYGDHAQFYDRDYAIELQHNEALVGYRWAESEYLPLVYPPFYYVATSPLSMLPARWAAVAWAALMLAFAIGAIYLWTRTWPWLTKYLGWICLAVVFYQPMVRNLCGGQKAAAMLAIFTLTYLLLRSQRSFAAGVVFSLLLFKPQLVPVMVLAALLKRDWRFLAGFTSTAVALALVSLAVGWDVCLQYVDLVLGMGNYIQTPGYRFAEAHSWQGFFALLYGPERLATIQVLTTTASVLTVGAVAICLCKRRNLSPTEASDWSTPQGMLQFAAITLAALLISPHLLTYDLSIALLPMVLCIVAATDERMLREYGRQLLMLAGGLYVATTISTGVANTIGVQISTVALAIVAARLMWLSGRGSHVTEGSSPVAHVAA
jgi:hypothetical protein